MREAAGWEDPVFRRKFLRDSLAREVPLVLPGATDAGGAILVEKAGFSACYITGAGIANAQFGLPDIGLVSQSEVLEQVMRVVAATRLPVVVDADTGYGGVTSVIRTVRLFEHAGAAALQFEDQVIPKRCGHFDGQSLVTSQEMQAKIAAAVAARTDSNLLVIARTDARGVLGLDEALRRGSAYLDAGADALFIEAPQTVHEMERIATEFAGIPLVANIVEGGKTPLLSVADLASIGFSIVLFANYLMRAMLLAGQQALAHLISSGESASFTDRLLSWEDRQAIFGLAAWTEVEKQLTEKWDGLTADEQEQPNQLLT